jgi:hypothetical protein
VCGVRHTKTAGVALPPLLHPNRCRQRRCARARGAVGATARSSAPNGAHPKNAHLGRSKLQRKVHVGAKLIIRRQLGRRAGGGVGCGRQAGLRREAGAQVAARRGRMGLKDRAKRGQVPAAEAPWPRACCWRAPWPRALPAQPCRIDLAPPFRRAHRVQDERNSAQHAVARAQHRDDALGVARAKLAQGLAGRGTAGQEVGWGRRARRGADSALSRRRNGHRQLMHWLKCRLGPPKKPMSCAGHGTRARTRRCHAWYSTDPPHPGRAPEPPPARGWWRRRRGPPCHIITGNLSHPPHLHADGGAAVLHEVADGLALLPDDGATQLARHRELHLGIAMRRAGLGCAWNEMVLEAGQASPAALHAPHKASMGMRRGPGPRGPGPRGCSARVAASPA